jgi:hypothetical protein
VSSKKPEKEGRSSGLLTRAIRWSIFMFAPPSDLNRVGYGANLRLVIGASPMTFWRMTIPSWNTCEMRNQSLG